jgi:hypothetical protein
VRPSVHFRPVPMSISVLVARACSFAAEPIKLELKHNSLREQQTKTQLEKLWAACDLSKYTFTHNAIIDENAIPHSKHEKLEIN